MNLVNNVKDKWAEHQFKKLEKEVIRLQEKISRIPEQQEKLPKAEILINPTERKNSPATRQTLETHIERKNGHGRGAESPHITKPYGLYTSETGPFKIRLTGAPGKKKINADIKALCKKQVQPKYLINKRPMKRSRKRCHFCRKRGHIQRDCLSRQMLRKRLWDGKRDVGEHHAEMQSVAAANCSLYIRLMNTIILRKE